VEEDDEEEEDDERDGDARARPKERLRWEARNDATPPPAASTSRRGPAPAAA
jgi:hypothetical protein